MKIELDTPSPTIGTVVSLTLQDDNGNEVDGSTWEIDPANGGMLFGNDGSRVLKGSKIKWDTGGAVANFYKLKAIFPLTGGKTEVVREIYLSQGQRPGPIQVATTISRTGGTPSTDQALWVAIRNRTRAIGFEAYSKFIDDLVCELADGRGTRVAQQASASMPPSIANRTLDVTRALSQGVYGFELLRLATDAFLVFQTGTMHRGMDGKISVLDPDLFDADQETSRLGYAARIEALEAKLGTYLGDANRLPYLNRIVTALVGTAQRGDAPLGCYQQILDARVNGPTMLELIWSYWHEEGALAQTMNAIALRFQNKRRPGHDPLAQLEIDPLRPLNTLLWGYIQSEYKRLSVVRRAYEYDHHYGISLQGRAVPQLSSADSRSKFLEAFHNLLSRAAAFYRADADTTVVADAYPVLNALRDLHLVLAEGAHNQFGDLPWTARSEMLVEQWLLARPEMREFLRGRAMVPYAEPWMGQVDAMKRLQGWRAAGVSSYRELGVYGEQILLSVRYSAWTEVNDETQARNWARYWKPEIQSYVHSYRAVTGGQVDLASEPVDEADALRRRMAPSVLMAERMLVGNEGRLAVTVEPRRAMAPVTARIGGGRNA